MPTDSRREQIIQRICTVLDGISTPTYWHDIESKNISRYPKSFDQIKDADEFPYIEVLTVAPETFSHQTLHHQDKGGLNMVLIMFVQRDEPQELATWVNRLVKDVIVALLADVTLNNLCRTLHLVSLITDDGALAHEKNGFAELQIKADYVFDWTDP
ncbi:MAG: hypothetical protein IH969_03310 [Candidatus Krumholzibacteriota bacterium]|nr:hypothetical protein [Candidatus Krumholzibacteriota bacterium]